MSKHDPVIKFTPQGNWIVANIPPEAALFMSRALADLSETLERTAKRERQAALEKVAQIQYGRHVDVMVEMLIDEGKSLHVAINTLANYGIAAYQVEYLWKLIQPRVARKARQKNRETARRLCREGYSNGKIAETLGCSTRTVSRLLNDAKKQKKWP